MLHRTRADLGCLGTEAPLQNFYCEQARKLSCSTGTVAFYTHVCIDSEERGE